MSGQIDFEQALDIVAKSYFLEEVIGKPAYNRLRKVLPDLGQASVTEIREKIRDFEDIIAHNIKSEKFLTYHIVSDDPGGSENGPWDVDVHGACGVWVVSSNEYDDLWFLDRDSAIEAANGYAHESVIEENNYGIRRFQENNSDVERSSKAAGAPTIRPLREKSDPDRRVLNFYLDNQSNKIYQHNKYAPDNVVELADVIRSALHHSEAQINSAIAKASELMWDGAVKTLTVALEAKRQILELERSIEQLKNARKLEIEVDDWCRRNNITTPRIEDFLRLAKEVRPFFRYREAAMAWDQNQPQAFRDAYERVVDTRRRIEAERSVPEEE